MSATEEDAADAAFATPLIVLRPAAFYVGQSRPRAALVVRYPGDDPLLQVVVRGLLRQGWQLIAPPVGAYEFDDQAFSPTATVTLDAITGRAGAARVIAGPEVIFEGSLVLDTAESGQSWVQLARGTGEIIVFVTVGDSPISSQDELDEIARAGHLVGVVGIVKANTRF